MKFINKIYNKYTKLLVKITISLFFIFWIVFKVDWIEVMKGVRKIQSSYLILYVFVVLLGMVISANKWKILANFKGIKIKLFDAFKLYLSGTFINNFMPSFIGGDTYKAYEIGKLEKKYIEGASSVTIDRIIGLFSAALLVVIFSFLNIQKVLESYILILVNLIILSFFIFGIIIFATKKKAFWSYFGRYLPSKILSFIIDLNSYNNDSSIIKKSILWSIFFNFIGIALANYIIFTAFGIEIGILNYLSVIFLISIISSIPISINNIGIKEWAYITFFGTFGLSASSVITIAITSRLIQMLISFLALPAYLASRKKIHN